MEDAMEKPDAAEFSSERLMDGIRLELKGRWTLDSPAIEAKAEALAAEGGGARQVVFDLAQVTRLDTAGAWLIGRVRQALASRGAETKFQSIRPEYAILLREAGYRALGIPRPLAHLPYGEHCVPRGAHHRAHQFPRRRDSCAARNLSAAPLRRDDLHRRSHRPINAARARGAADSHHGRRPLGLRNHRRAWLDEAAGGDRCADCPRVAARRYPHRPAHSRPCCEPAPAHLPRRYGGHFRRAPCELAL